MAIKRNALRAVGSHTSTRRKVRWRVAVAATAALLAGGAAAAAETGQPLQVTRAIHATEDDPAPTRTYTSPFLLAEPADPTTAVASVVEMRGRTCHLLRTRDGGRSWRLLDASPSPDAYPFCFHTSGTTTMTPMAWGRNSTLYYGLSGWGPQDAVATGEAHAGTRGNLSVLVARSTDLGDSWETTIARDARGKTGEEVENNRPVSSLAVDATSGGQDIVYVGYSRRLPLADPEQPRAPMVATSIDGGRTFEPVNVLSSYRPQIGDASTYGGSPPQLAVDDHRTVYVLFTASAEDTDDVLLVARSTDRGQSFEVSEVGTVTGSFAYPAMRWSPAGGEQGTLHLIYEDKPDGPLGDRDIYYRRSTDRGATFSEPRLLNDDDPSRLYGQFNANLSVAPDGRVDAVWWDFRDDPGAFANNVYYAYSSDNGATWSANIRVTDRSIRRDIGTWSNGFDMRQPPGVASTDAYALFAWDDTRFGEHAGQAQDVFSAAVQFDVLPAGGNPRWYAVAALAGLTLAGLVLLLLGARLRAGRGGAPDRRRPVGAGV